MEQYMCQDCKYKFTKKDKPKKCPYCDSTNVSKPKLAQDWLNEVSSDLDDIDARKKMQK